MITMILLVLGMIIPCVIGVFFFRTETTLDGTCSRIIFLEKWIIMEEKKFCWKKYEKP